MAPHQCESYMKTILTDKNFSPQSFLKSGFGDFLLQILSYLQEFNKEQETGFFKRAKYVDTKSLLKSLRVVLQAANASTYRPELLKQLDQIFCTLLHPKTATAYRDEAVDIFFLIISFVPEENLTYLANSFTLLVPHLIAAQQVEVDVFERNLYSKYKQIIDPAAPKPTLEEASKSLENVLAFIYKNWNSRTKLCVNLLFNSILKVVYKGSLDKRQIDTFQYGFSQLPLTFHHNIIKFLLDLVNNEMNLRPLLETKEQVIIVINMLSMVSTHNDIDEFITTFRLLQSLLTSLEYFKRIIEADDKAILEILNITATIITVNSGKRGYVDSPLLTVFYDFFNSLLEAALCICNLDTSLMFIQKAILNHEDDILFNAYFTVSTFRWMINKNDRRPELWKFMTKLLTETKINAAATSFFAQYLVARAVPEIFKINKAEALQLSQSFVVRNKRNRQESRYDFIAENIQTIFDAPHEFVRTLLSQAWEDLKSEEKVLKNVYIQPLDIKDGEDLVDEIVFFHSQFHFYPTLQFDVQKQHAFAPIYTISSLMADMMLFPPGISFDTTVPFAVCGNFLFDSIFNQTNSVIAYAAFNDLSRILNLNEMKAYLSDKSLSQWYAALILMLSSADQKKRTKAFKEAQITLQHSFTGATILQPFMMAMIEDGYVPLDSPEFSFLCSFPMLSINFDIPKDFKNSIYSIIKKKPDAYIDVEKRLERPVGNLRDRSINFISAMHEKRSNELDGSPTWDLLIPTYSALIADEIIQEKPNKDIIFKFLMFFTNAIKNKRSEAILSIRSLLMYRKELVEMIPDELSKFVTELTNETISIKPSDDPVWTFGMIRLLCDVFISTSSIMKTGEAYTSYIKFLFAGISKKKESGYPQEVQTIMKNVLDILAKQYCRYPSPTTPQFMTNTSHFRGDKMKYFTLNGAVTETCTKDDGVFVANQFPSGQYTWSFTPLQENLLHNQDAEEINTPLTPKAKENIIPTYKTPKQGEFSKMMDTIVDSYQSDFKDDFEFDEIVENDGFNSIMNKIDEEYSTMKSNKPKNLNAKFPRPEVKIYNLTSSVFVATGRVRVDHLDKLKCVKTEGRALDVLEKANSNSIKLGTKFGVLFVGQDCADQNQILQIQLEQTTPHFHEFITGLGWPIELQKHIGYLGGLDTKNAKNGRTSIYYTDSMHEMMFHIGPIIPNDPNDPQQIYKKRHIGNDHVHIVWCAGNKDYNTSTITSQFNQAHIVIYPLQTALFRVDVFWRQELDWFGPLRHSTVVNKRALPSLVRETAENAMITFYQKQSAFAHPSTDVAGHIKNISQNFIVDSPKTYDPLINLMVMD